ncbi:MAG TPA: ABC transporter permease [Armatimonadota bacterium]|nr:ABC transporter permease [Armatimonadota bacterium]
MLLRTWMIAWKESLQIRRDPRTLLVVIALPVLMLVLYGYAFNLDVKHLTLAVYDQDHTRAGRDLIGAFSHSEYFDLAGSLTSYQEVESALDRGEAKVALIIPARFGTELASGRPAPVQVIIDGSDSTTASTAIGYAALAVQQYSRQVTVEALRRAGLPGDSGLGPLDMRGQVWYNPELRSTNFLVPGLIAVILSMLAALLISMTVARERERGTIEPLIASPVMPHELMLGKLLPYAAIAFVDIVLVILAGLLLFHVPLRGSPSLLLGLSALFLLTSLAIGLLISTVSTSQQTAMTVAMLVTQLPAMLLSGFVFPIRAMPPVLQWITNFVPARHFLVIVRGIFLKGIGISILWEPALILLLYSVALIGLCSFRFRKKL